MDIVIISEFGEDYSASDNDRFIYLAKMLTAGPDPHDVEIVTSSFRHTAKKHRREAAAQWPFQITFIDEPGYPKNICLQRFKSHLVWGKNLMAYLSSRKRPDVIYCAIPSLSGPNKVARYCEKNHIRFVIDIQDLWPEAFQMVLNVPLVSSLVFAPFTILANGIYKRADAICAVSDTYCHRALKTGWKEKGSTVVFLGTELETFDRYASGQPILEKQDGEIWLAYCGTLGSSYDLTCVIDALAELKNNRIRFIVMGDGPKQADFEAYAKEKNISAVFTGRLKYDQMCSLLKACDITVNPIAHHAAQSIINKHADYAASGLPVINTQENEEYRNLVDQYTMGFNCSNSDPEDLAEKIRTLAEDEALRFRMGQNARHCAEEKFDRKHTYRKLAQVIENRCKNDGIL